MVAKALPPKGADAPGPGGLTGALLQARAEDRKAVAAPPHSFA